MGPWLDAADVPARSSVGRGLAGAARTAGDEAVAVWLAKPAGGPGFRRGVARAPRARARAGAAAEPVQYLHERGGARQQHTRAAKGGGGRGMSARSAAARAACTGWRGLPLGYGGAAGGTDPAGARAMAEAVAAAVPATGTAAAVGVGWPRR